MADFKFYLNRQGPKGEPGAKGEKGDNGNTPTFSDGINTPTVYTMQIDMGDGNVFETQNLKYPMRDDGGNYLRYDRTNSTVTLSAPNVADLQRTSGEVTLASVSDVENEDAQNTDAVSMELRNADQLALDNEINRIDGDIDTVDDKVDREIQNRQDADITLSGRIDGLDSSKANKSDVYTKTQTDSLLNNKSNVGHTHNYNDLTNKPDIGNGTITITQGGVVKGSFTTNQLSNGTIALDAGSGGGATYTSGPGIVIDQNNEISANVDNNTIVVDGNSLKANIPDVSNFVTNTQLASTLTAYPTNNALSNAITYQTVSVPGPSIYTLNRTINPYFFEYSMDPSVERDGVWSKVGVSTYTRDKQLVIPEQEYNVFLLVNILLFLETNECVKCRSGYTFSFECNPQVTISYFDPESDDNSYNASIDANTSSNNVFNVSSSSEGYTTLNIRLLRDIYITSITVRYNPDSNGHTPSMFLTPLYNFNGEVEVYTKSEGTPTTTTKAIIASTAVDGTTIGVNTSGQLQSLVEEPGIATSSALGLVQPDNSTITVDGNGVISANIPTPATVDQTYDATSTNAQSGVAIAGAGFLTSVPDATTSSKGLVQPDGTTVTINNGVISATSSAPSNMVTTDTSQDISGAKTFRVTSTNYTPTLKLQGYNGTGNNDFIIVNSNNYTSPAGVSIGYAFSLPVIKIFGSTSGAYSTFITYNGLYRNGSDTFTFWKDYAKNSKIVLKNYQDIILDSSMVDSTTINYNSTSGKIEVPVDGTYIIYDSNTGKVTLDLAALKTALDAL